MREKSLRIGCSTQAAVHDPSDAKAPQSGHSNAGQIALEAAATVSCKGPMEIAAKCIANLGADFEGRRSNAGPEPGAELLWRRRQRKDGVFKHICHQPTPTGMRSAVATAILRHHQHRQTVCNLDSQYAARCRYCRVRSPVEQRPCIGYIDHGRSMHLVEPMGLRWKLQIRAQQRSIASNRSSGVAYMGRKIKTAPRSLADTATTQRASGL